MPHGPLLPIKNNIGCVITITLCRLSADPCGGRDVQFVSSPSRGVAVRASPARQTCTFVQFVSRKAVAMCRMSAAPTPRRDLNQWITGVIHMQFVSEELLKVKKDLY